MTLRPGPLRAAAALAATFVAVRVVYRVLFHGADGSGAVLLALPSVRLPPPFAHVVLLGPVTTDGLRDAAASALPIALTILAFGVLNALVDLPRLFVRGARRGPLSGIARAVAIAWATLPSLADAGRAVRFAQRLRGERAGVRMLAPLLQRTLERAGGIAAALELRGLAGRALDGDCLEPATAEDVSIGFGSAPVVRVGTLALGTKSLTLVSGPTGSGKSTLLRALSGLHTHVDGGWVDGALQVAGHPRTAVPPRDLSRLVGVVPQHPREAFATELVRDEIGLALELRGVARTIVAARVAEVAARVGIEPLLDRPTRGLSAGEATLVALAAAVVERPIVLLVDEPFADLDSRARARVAALLDALAHEAGMCVVVAEHRVAGLVAMADVRLRIRNGVLVDGVVAPAVALSVAPAVAPDAPVVLRAEGVTVRHRGVVAVDAAILSLRAGELVALVGPNGAGKSTLLAALTGDPRVTAEGRVALVPDASDDLFVSDSVAAECRRADRRSTARTATRFARFLGLDPDSREFAARLARHPRDLSVGERRCLALAIQLAGSPTTLLVDEPTRGLDPDARRLVWAALTSLAADGAAVLVASHEPEVAAAADRVLPMRGGVVGAVVADAGAARAHSAIPDAVPVDAPGSRGASREAPADQNPRVDTLGSRRDHALPARTTDGFDETLGSRRGANEAHDDRQRPRPGRHRGGRLALVALIAANVVALGAFCWPLVANAVPADAQAAVPAAALGLAPLAALVVVATLDGTVRSAHMLALLGTLAAIGAAVRIASTGVGGVEAVFILLILAGRAFGARFGMLLGMATIALSTLVTGTFGPWTPFQMFACAWVGAGAGLLPRRVSARTEIAMLCVYGVLASYAFGLIMNFWYWPFAVGFGTDISYTPGAPLSLNLSRFLLYSLVTSTLSWDTLRAITTVVGILVIGRAVLSALRRAKPLTAAALPSSLSRSGASTHAGRSPLTSA
ncbi:ATP-binding cassette domain-containing protein [Microbacterium sp. AZCO]|uniref:ATP-binding cassette domain-containing protein n=1 Tax=Microbacterium sp. AZCO TaxID=3142976 RepID=UPI0031F36803